MSSVDQNQHTLIAIPAFNEERNIRNLLEQLRPWEKDVIVIDDGSSDNTVRLVKESGFNLISKGFNAGLASFYNTARAFAIANNYTHLVAADSDGQHDPACIPEFIKALENNDLVTGDRFHNVEGIPDSKISSNLFAILLIKDMLNITLPDAACGFRGIKINILPEFDEDQGFGIIYNMLISHSLAQKPISFIKIPAIYHTSDLMNTNIPEIRGLLSTVKKYKPSPELDSMMEAVSNKSDFHITLSACNFSAFFEQPGAYRFATDIPLAKQYFKQIHQHHTYKGTDYETR